MRSHLFRIVLAVLAVTLGLAAGNAAAQPYPNKVIRVIFQAPGGNTDIIFRILQRNMEEILGRQLVFEFRPGSGGIAGMEMTAKSAPDGYTTSVVASSFLINPL